MYFTENPLKRQSNKINMVDAQNHNVGLWFWENFRDTLVNFTVYQLAGRTATSSGELSMINSYRKLLPAQSWGKTTSLWQFHPKLNLKKKFSSHLCSTINYCWQKIVPSEIRLIMFNGGGGIHFFKWLSFLLFPTKSAHWTPMKNQLNLVFFTIRYDLWWTSR